jgi:2,4-dienoyl-CoA reductase-like NADH-dependent reductase (Old Yellow Enzyme family)
VIDPFQPAELAGIKLKNRIIRSATHEGMADENGYPTDTLKKKYITLAKGEVGVIITGYTAIQPNGRGPNIGQLKIYTDDAIKSYAQMVDAVHEYETPIIMQIAHAGRQTRSKITGYKPVAPSAIKDKYYYEEVPKELSDSEIDEIIDNFVKAIIRAKSAGFDGVQIHEAHGYLLSQFLSPYTNRRNDKWGGNIENRFRIIREIYNRAQKEVGDYPIFIKINAYDGRKNGATIEESVKVAKLLEEIGCSGIEVSCGVYEDKLFTVRGEPIPTEAALAYSFQYKNLPSFVKAMIKPMGPLLAKVIRPIYNYNNEAAVAIKSEVSIPVIVVGGIHTVNDIKNALDSKVADFVALCRPFIIEPDIVKKYKEGKQDRSKCISCCICGIAQEVRPLQCYYGKVKY